MTANSDGNIQQLANTNHDSNLERLLQASPHSFLENTFTCAFCNNSVRDAWFLSCLHSFCTACISSQTQINDLIKCPLCPNFGDTYRTALKSNLLPGIIESLKQLRKIIKKGTEYKCNNCLLDNNALATSYCLQCGSFICDVEVRAHQKYDMSSHNIIELTLIKECSVNELIATLTTIQLTSDKRTELKIKDSQANASMISITELIATAVQKLSEVEAIKDDIEKQWTDKKGFICDQYENLLNNIAGFKLSLIQQLEEDYKNLLLPHETSIKQLNSVIGYCKHLYELSKYLGICEVTEQLKSQITLMEGTLRNFTPVKSKYSVELKTDLDLTLKTVSRFIKCSRVLNENDLLHSTELIPAQYCFEDKTSIIRLYPKDMAIKGDFIYLLFENVITINCYSNKILTARTEIPLPADTQALSFIIDKGNRFIVITPTNVMILSFNSVIQNIEHKLKLEDLNRIKICESMQLNFVHLITTGKLIYLNILDGTSQIINIGGYTSARTALVILDLCYTNQQNSLLILAQMVTLSPSSRYISEKESRCISPRSRNIQRYSLPGSGYNDEIITGPVTSTDNPKSAVIFILHSLNFDLVRKIDLTYHNFGPQSFMQSSINGVWLIDVENDKCYLHDIHSTKSNKFQKSNSVLVEKLNFEVKKLNSAMSRSYYLNNDNQMLYLNSGIISFLELT